MDIKNLELTDEDFALLVDGLDALPEKGMSGEILGDLMMGMLADKNNPEAMAQVKKDREATQAKRKREQEAKRDDISILKGKLIMLKRFLQQEGALKEVNGIINHT